MTLPNFIMIGAAKAGTTAMNAYLSDHPDVFMCPVKETNYFAYGLDETGKLRYGDPALHRFPVTSANEYEKLFDGCADETAIGEASPIYLECPGAARRIRRMLPDARIICGLRNPVDRAYSDYQMYLRSMGRRLEPGRDLVSSAHWAQPGSHWMRVGLYHEALLRYFHAFPRHRIHVFLFDDFRIDPRAVVRDAYRFLDVDSNVTPDFATPYNVGGVPANMLLERIIAGGGYRMRNMLEQWMPRAVNKALRRLRASNMEKAPPLPSALRKEMARYFHDDIRRTAELVGRNLDGWLDDDDDDISGIAHRLAGGAYPVEERGQPTGH